MHALDWLSDTGVSTALGVSCLTNFQNVAYLNKYRQEQYEEIVIV